MAKNAKANILGRASSVKLRVPRKVLVFETTGFALRGVPAWCDWQGRLHTGAVAESRAADFATAVGEVLEQLRGQTRRALPRNAVLVTPSVASDLLSLPVDPRSPKPKAQMRELVRWELEEVFVRQSEIWSLGALLQGRGYVSAARRREVEREAAQSGRGQAAFANAYREIVTKEQLAECLTLQESLLGMDDGLVTGWSPQTGTGEEGRFVWYCGGLAEGVRTAWVQAFQKHGVFCAWFYPQLGAARPLLGAEKNGTLLVEVRQEQFALFQSAGATGTLEALSIQPGGSEQVAAVAAAAGRFVHPETRVAHVVADAEKIAPLTAVLQQTLVGVEVRALNAPGADAEETAPAISPALEGVARHALRLCSSRNLVRIEAQPPRPPFWKSRGFWPWAIIALVFVSMVGLEVSNRIRTHLTEQELERLDIEYELNLQIKNEATKTQTEIKELERTLAEKERLLTERKRQIEMLDSVILHRKKLVPGLLRAVSESIPEDVVMDVLEENNDRSGFRLEGWALRDTDGQRFGSQLNEKLAPLKYKVADIRLTQGRGRFGVDGFVVKIVLTKVEPPKQGGKK